ncbi:MAG: TetR family transcriptional regulator [Chloroflexi bacterium]|nr:TetR family transcriptional regulator [Chloroflexota bacterium]
MKAAPGGRPRHDPDAAESAPLTPRDQILAATRDLLAKPDGERQFTIGRVANTAHVSRATIYRYFPNKTALLLAAGATNGAGSGAPNPRTRILDAAFEVFAERGLHATSLGQISQRAGLSLSGLHWHFRNRDELVAALSEYVPLMPAIVSEALAAEDDSADLEAQLTRIARVAIAFMAQRRGLIRLVIFESATYPDVARFGRTHTLGRLLPLLAAIFERHARRGTLRPGSALARAQAFMGMLMLLALLRPAFDDVLAPDDEATAREYVQIMLRGVLAAPSGERP